MNWYEYLITWPVWKYLYVLAGAIARSFADNRDAEVKRSGKEFMKFVCANAVLSTACAAVVLPLSAEMGFNSNWQHLALFFAGYMGLGFLDLVQAKLRFAINEKGGKTDK
jgi:hypothetical protein